MNKFTAYVPTKVLFGTGKLNELSEQSLPGKKSLVITSNGKSTKENGYLDRTIKQLEKLQKDCGVDNLKMSDYGISERELDTLAKNVRETMGGLFYADSAKLSHNDVVEI